MDKGFTDYFKRVGLDISFPVVRRHINFIGCCLVQIVALVRDKSIRLRPLLTVRFFEARILQLIENLA
jgi:hypothetical protein